MGLGVADLIRSARPARCGSSSDAVGLAERLHMRHRFCVIRRSQAGKVGRVPKGLESLESHVEGLLNKILSVLAVAGPCVGDAVDWAVVAIG